MTKLKNALTEAALREFASDRSFERGAAYARKGYVRSMLEDDNEIRGKVHGARTYTARLWVEKRSLGYSCSCPVGTDGDFCKHCVALGLVWLNGEDSRGDTPPKRTKPSVTLRDVRAYLAAQKTATLVDLLMEHAERDESLQRRLLMLAAKKMPQGLDLATYRKAIDDALLPDGFVPYEDVYEYARNTDEVIDSIRALLDEGHAAAVVELAEHALRTVEKAMESADDSDGRMSEALGRLQDLHYSACEKAKPEPAALAKRLFDWKLHGTWDTFHDAVETYADILGTKGLDVYRRLAEEQWARVPVLGPGKSDRAFDGTRFRITSTMEALARRTGDVEALVAVKQRDLSSPWAYLQIAETYKAAKKHELALEWAERGVKAFAGDRDRRLFEFLAAEYHRRKRHGDAMALAWTSFEAEPWLGGYQNLKAHADKARQWPQWREKALDFVRERIRRDARSPHGVHWRTDHSTLVEIFVWENDFESAWSEASSGGCSDNLWHTLARWREKSHPADAVPIYWKDVHRALARMGNDAYAEAVQVLRRIRSLMQRIGLDKEFVRELAALRTAHKAKRNFMKLLDGAKWS